MRRGAAEPGRGAAVAAAAAVLAVLLGARPALAHKLYVFTLVEGATIQGKAYFRGDVPAQGAKVEVFAPDGRKLAETVTDADGKFTVRAEHRCDHRLLVNAGGGHGGEGMVRADELPEDLPPLAGHSPAAPEASGDGPAGQAEPAAESGRAKPQATDSPAAQSAAADIDEARLKRIVEAAVQRQLGPLREQIDHYERKIRTSDVLGGIGYIVGLAGLLFYFLGIRKKTRKAGSAPES